MGDFDKLSIPPHMHSLPQIRAGQTTYTDKKDLFDCYRITMDVPSFNKNNLCITFKQGILKVSGTNYSLEKERRIDESFSVPEADDERISVTLEDGLLNIEIKKKPEFIPKIIKF